MKGEKEWQGKVEVLGTCQLVVVMQIYTQDSILEFQRWKYKLVGFEGNFAESILGEASEYTRDV